jgi:hypothetical protein
MQREIGVGDEKQPTWLAMSDFVNFVGMAAFVFGVVLFPVLGKMTPDSPRIFFGLGVLLFFGHAIGLAGHYELYNRYTARSFEWFPLQERVTFGFTLLCSVIYLLFGFSGL